jgi:polar amino acid transport system substrate-binding protein
MKSKFPLLIEESAEGARRIRQIVEDLKDFARGGSELQGEEECDLNAIVQRASRLTDQLIYQKTENFQLHLSPARPMLRGNRRRLEQVLINL